MTNADLDRIESELDLKLPEFYCRTMLDYPQWLPEKQPEWSDVVNGEFADDADQIIHFNRTVREMEPGELFDDISWPLHYFVIGSEEEQNWFFLDLSSTSEAVHMFHHERGEVYQVASSLAGFTEYLLDWWSDVEQWG